MNVIASTINAQADYFELCLNILFMYNTQCSLANNSSRKVSSEVHNS
jgi:hypothetical protein